MTETSPDNMAEYSKPVSSSQEREASKTNTCMEHDENSRPKDLIKPELDAASNAAVAVPIKAQQVTNNIADSPRILKTATAETPTDSSKPAVETALESPVDAQPPKRKELKCKSCKFCMDERVPAAIFQKMDDGVSVAIKVNPKCGHPFTVVINRSFEVIDHVCTSYAQKETPKDDVEDFDFDRFIEGSEELDDFLLKQQTRRASKLVSLEDQMKVAVKKLVKPLAILVPTAVQKKSEEQLRAERDDRLRQIVEIEANITYLRVLEFEKAAIGASAYPIEKLSRMLKNLDRKYIIGFIQRINNDFLISYNEKTQTVHFYNPSKPELEILSREFEKWLRFNRL
ncbi:MAG: hypothetical protein Q6373_016000 [Candidatus Sigynarchaeota archaeon]